MKHIQLTAIASLSALALFGCQAPSHTQTTQPTHTTTQTQPVTHNNAVKPIRTLNAVTCNDQSVNLNLNQGGVAQQGMLQGYKYCEYNIPLQAGQHLNVDFDSSSLGAYVIVYGRDDLSMTELTDNGYTATQNEVLPVRVLLTRNEARNNTQVPFKVQFNLR
ncbi:hypothetical protein [Psychrobacter sp. I-STPA6b]|uniref:hypothetical protein n=1 Tax=Psychrobacter sp. I-STPA6b TaxID=2585718 RepID=UPI001D0C9760|nr:hypothetical protein [Psychrobacter sp. I-STPA6b]